MFERDGSSLHDIFAEIREEVPEFATAERELGSRRAVARNVMRLRIQRGYTQHQLAEVLGVRQPRIAQIESARANLKIDTLDRLAAVFSVEPSRLLQAEQAASAPRPKPIAAD